LGQAEHDTNSQCILISKDKNFINRVKTSLTNQLKDLPRKLIAKKSLILNGILIHVKSDKQIIDIVNMIAPEHLELNIKNYKKIVTKIKIKIFFIKFFKILCFFKSALISSKIAGSSIVAGIL